MREMMPSRTKAKILSIKKKKATSADVRARNVVLLILNLQEAGEFDHALLQIGEWTKFTMIKTYRT
jgi:hypothetical protein